MQWLDRKGFEFSLDYPWFFRHVARPMLYRRARKEAEEIEKKENRKVDVPEVVHRQAVAFLNDNLDLLGRHKGKFEFGNLYVQLNGRRIKAFGTAAGLDKNGDALVPFSYAFGYQTPGTVIVPKRKGNDPKRVCPDDRNEDLYNAQGFPSEGGEYFYGNVRNYFFTDCPKVPLKFSLTGIPTKEMPPEEALLVAKGQVQGLVETFKVYAAGFEWNPFSPNTDTMKMLRTPESFREYAEIMRRAAPDKIRLVKMGPYEDSEGERREWFSLLEAWLEGGGHGVTVVNTKKVPKEQVPEKEWGYQTAAQSGRSLKPNRLRAVKEVRERYPEAVICATGGIFEGEDAYDTFKLGANMVESLTPVTFYGLGLESKKMQYVSKRLKKEGYQDLMELQYEARKGAKLLCNAE